MILRDEPEAVYHARPEVSNSKLAKLAKSPLNYWAHFVAPEDQRVVSTQTDALVEGAAFHCLTLEPHLFDKRFYKLPDGVRRDARTKVYQQHLEDAGDRLIVPAKAMVAVEAMSEAVLAHDKARELIEGADYRECTVLWTDEDTGIECRGRIDLLSTSREYMIDLKKTRDAAPHRFNKSIFDYGYDRQCAMYKDGIRQQDGLVQAADWPFLWICVEPEPPYHVAVYGDSEASTALATASWEDVGRVRYKKLLAQLKECMDNGQWPGYGDDIELLTPPSWAIEHIIGTPTGE